MGDFNPLFARPIGKDEGPGVFGNAKTRRHYPVSQVAEYCPRRSKCRRLQNTCKKCLRYSEFKDK